MIDVYAQPVREKIKFYRTASQSSDGDRSNDPQARAVRIGLETGQLTTWLWQALTDAGLPMVCLDARQARAALNMKINKTTMPRAWLTWCGPAGIARYGSRVARPCLRGRCSARGHSCWAS